MDFQQAAILTCGATVAYALYGRYRYLTIRDVPGPKNPSWIHGHQWYWQCEEAGAVEKRLLEEYGTIARWNGPLGEGRLWIADPKAIHHILQGSSHLYGKLHSTREVTASFLDKGLSWAEGDVHRRQRKAMAPAFGLVGAKGLFPYFLRCSNSLADKWHEAISSGKPGQAVIIDINSWLSKATLDAIGAGAFGYDFGALENTDNKLAKSYVNLTFAVVGMPLKKHLFVRNISRWAPKGFTTWMLERDKRPGMVMLRKNRECAHEVAAKLIEEKRQELKDGASRRDLLSLLVKANTALQPEWRLSDEEIVAQVRTVMFAGHETTAKTLTFALWELAKKRHIQERLRAEIAETLTKIRARGDSDFTVDDFDSMPYLLAVGKETLRVHPIAAEIPRVATENNVLPLTKPIVGVSGKVYKELPVPAGTLAIISTVGYNLNKDLWGPDPYEFRPERWLDMKEPESPVGVYSNLSTFSGGVRSCIGWRFAVIEMHTFLVTLVRQFDFSLPDNGQEIRRLRQGVLSPVIVGEERKGPQLPLKVTALGNE
ncbi:cytochrome P450 [Thelephora ganbajun]|uniref:Cytochrome P450 n=1 Tax=Thelephora ganbajun TaxID=370292 RepID=A0ACB6Z8E2_THEGA|nr:cytochrome P450 [Thelephora ganbajun]